MNRTISNRRTDSSLYIKATVGSSFHWQKWGKWPKIALLPYTVAFLPYTYTKQTNNKEQKQKILLSYQISNGKMET